MGTSQCQSAFTEDESVSLNFVRYLSQENPRKSNYSNTDKTGVDAAKTHSLVSQ